MTPTLPAQQTDGPYRVAVVCLGNICRSPVAHVVLREKVARAGLAGRVVVRSGGTADWHVGKDMDPRSKATLVSAGYDASGHAATQYRADWQRTEDLVLVMDRSNLADAGGGTDRLRLFRDFDPIEPGSEVPDPYYGGEDGFSEVLAMVERTCDVLVDALRHDVAGARTDSGRSGTP